MSDELQGRDPEHTYEHVPGCDDDGWDHRGPCVVDDVSPFRPSNAQPADLTAEPETDKGVRLLRDLREFLAHPDKVMAVGLDGVTLLIVKYDRPAGPRVVVACDR
jgi:hypothetical protein